MYIGLVACLAVGAVAEGYASGHKDPKLTQSSGDIRDTHVTRVGSQLLLGSSPWKAVGANVYWLGLDENVIPPTGEPFDAARKASYPTKGRITEAMAIVKAMGGTTIRSHTLGVSTGGPLSLMPALGQVNPRAFESIDWAVYQARQHGLRLLVPLTDNFDYYHGGKYNFLRWHGFNLTQANDATNPQVQQFYTNASIMSSFKEYIRTLVTHVNPYTNLSYAEDPTIWAYETGNELCGPVWGDMDVPKAWVSEIGRFVKELAPRKLVTDGTYGVNASHLGITEIDVFSNHYYPVDNNKLQADLKMIASVNKTYWAGEYGWKIPSPDLGDDALGGWFRMLESSPYAIGSAFWSLFGHNVPDCSVFVNHSDGFTLQYGNLKNSAEVNASISLIRGHFLRMTGQGNYSSPSQALPVVPCTASVEGRQA